MASMVVELERVAQDGFAAAGIHWPGLWIISGHRSKADQARINPSVSQSFHTYCPALAVDLRVGNIAASITENEVWELLGDIWKDMGGRWGGDFRTPDMNHFDYGYMGPPTQLPGLMDELTRPFTWLLPNKYLTGKAKTLQKVINWVLRLTTWTG